MSIGLVLPGLVVVALSTAAGLVRWRLQPMTSVRVLAGIAAVAATTMMLILVTAVAGFASRLPVVSLITEWCGLVPRGHDISTFEGAVALVLAAAISARMWRVMGRRRRAVEGTGGRRLTVLETAEPIAYAAPGRPGCVVVSRGLLEALEPRERQVVLAHERAHLLLNHHRYLLIGEFSLAVVPLLGPLIGQVRLATERSADESAAAALGGDRRLVATTIARAAVTTSAFHGTVGSLGGASVPMRVEALLAPPTGGDSKWMAMSVSLVLVIAGTAQTHHLFRIVQHVCTV